MDNRFEEILAKAIRMHCTDIHFKVTEGNVEIALRGMEGLVRVKGEACDIRLFNYLQYISRLDITSIGKPQSGSFEYFFKGNYYSFRFSVMSSVKMKNGVLRILNCHQGLSLQQLTWDERIHQTFMGWLKKKSGMILFTGLTGSGKTTTLYSLLAMAKGKTIYSLEDPIEIVQDHICQMEINEKTGFGYDEGIRQVLRHNPDILMIGEIRDAETAKMAFRAALTGCLVFSSLHAKSTVSAIGRLIELGVNKDDIMDCLLAVVNQRLAKRKGKKQYVCVYDILPQRDIQGFLNGRKIEPKMDEIYENALTDGFIEDEYE